MIPTPDMNRLLILALLFLSSCSLFKQASLAPDPRTDSLILQGKQDLRQGEYMDAWDSFEVAREREFNRSTTAATYLAGLAAYHLSYDDIAEARFGEIIKEFPKSKYVDDARYHLALIQLRKGGSLQHEFSGLDELLLLAQNARDSRLKSMALDSWRSHLFKYSDRDLLETYSRTAPSAYQAYVMEALIYRILDQDGPMVAQTRLNSFTEDGGRPTQWLLDIFPDDSPVVLSKDPRWENPSLLKLALVLPFQMNQLAYPSYLQEIPSNQIRPLEFYEGFSFAVDEFQASSNKRVYVDVIDSRRDTVRTAQLFSRLDSIGIQCIVGDIYNAQSRVLSRWAESRGVPQIVPLSPSPDLIEQKRNTFLANPIAQTHGKAMAKYAFDRLGLRHMYIFTDGSPSTQELLSGFRREFIIKGGTIDTLLFSQNFEEVAVKQIPDLARSIPGDAFQAGIYLPIMGNEEAASLILNILLQQGKQLPVLGSPHFRSSYTSISNDIKSSFDLIFSTSYLTDPQDPLYTNFYQKYLREYGLPPSEYAIQGYDLGRYILQQLNLYNPASGMDFSSFLKAAPVFSTIHLPYWFTSSQSNQAVNLGQFSEVGIIKLR